MNPDVGIFMVVQAGSAQLFVLKVKSQWFDQMELGAGIGAQADDVAGIRGDLRFVEDDVREGIAHLTILSGPSGRNRLDLPWVPQ